MVGLIAPNLVGTKPWRRPLGKTGSELSLPPTWKVESLELKTNVVAAYVMSELSKEVPGLMSAMQV